MNMPVERNAVWRGETPLVCLARIDEARDCTSFVLAPSSAQRFEFLPGQFVSLGVEIEGKVAWRAYSISSCPTRPDSLSITVKRVEGGRVSNWLIDHWQVGMSLPALAPAGEFCLRPGADALPEVLAFFSAGSGITPLMSMTRWLLATRQAVDIHFFHSARSEADFIFAEELLAMAATHDRLHLHLFLSRPEGRLAAQSGRLDCRQLKARWPDGRAARAWLCGQNDYMDAVAGWLQECGLPAAHIARESFLPLSVPGGGAGFTLDIPAFGRTAGIAEGESLLDVLEREGLPVIGACRTGVCGSCKCKVVAGDVAVSSTLPLTPDEIAAGYVLACSSTARNDLVLELA